MIIKKRIPPYRECPVSLRGRDRECACAQNASELVLPHMPAMCVCVCVCVYVCVRVRACVCAHWLAHTHAYTNTSTHRSRTQTHYNPNCLIYL